jgi:hypothetical protein
MATASCRSRRRDADAARLGAAFALVWREEGDLCLWVHLARQAP